MAATAGTMNFIGTDGQSLSVNVYVPDAVATQWTFNPQAAAASTSPAQFRLPKDCYFVGVDLLAAPTATAAVIQINGANVAGTMLAHSANLVSLANRQKFSVPIKAGDFVSVLQS